MQLLASWKDSLNLLKPANFKLFFLVTLKALKDTYKVWLKYWWWLVLLFFSWEALIIYVGSPNMGKLLAQVFGITQMMISFIFSGPLLMVSALDWGLSSNLWLAAIYGSIFLAYLTLLLSARPSVRLKNYRYFFHYGIHALYIAAWFVFIGFVSFFYLMVAGPAIAECNHALFVVCSRLFQLFVIFCTLFFILFFLDSDGSIRLFIKSILRGFKLFLFNMPVLLLLGVVFMALYWLLSVLFAYIPVNWGLNLIVSRLGFLLFISFVICFITNYYTKRLHDQFNLYFETK